MKTKSAVTILASLAQDSRLAIFRILVQAGPTGMPAGKIAKDGNIPPSSLSFHMKELLYANLVNARHEGRFIFYSANFSTMNDLLAFLTENCCGDASCTTVCNPPDSVTKKRG